jgi:hypothetical protein
MDWGGDDVVPNNVIKINGKWAEAQPIQPSKPMPLEEMVRLCNLRLIDGKVHS